MDQASGSRLCRNSGRNSGRGVGMSMLSQQWSKLGPRCRQNDRVVLALHRIRPSMLLVQCFLGQFQAKRRFRRCSERGTYWLANDRFSAHSPISNGNENRPSHGFEMGPQETLVPVSLRMHRRDGGYSPGPCPLMQVPWIVPGADKGHVAFPSLSIKGHKITAQRAKKGLVVARGRSAGGHYVDKRWR